MLHEKYQAVMFDLLTALLDSWSLWNEVAGSEEVGVTWRKRYLQLTYQAGAYRSYEGIIEEAAQGVEVPAGRTDQLIERWGELEPWPETRQVLRTLLEKVPVAVATNASVALAQSAVAVLGIPIPTVVTAEEAGYYKPHPQPYRMALQRLHCAPASVLFVAGSAADVPGASALGMPVFWHNRRRLSPVEARVQPRQAGGLQHRSPGRSRDQPGSSPIPLQPAAHHGRRPLPAGGRGDPRPGPRDGRHPLAGWLKSLDPAT